MGLQSSFGGIYKLRTKLEYASIYERVAGHMSASGAAPADTNELAERFRSSLVTLSKDLAASSRRRNRAAMRFSLRDRGFSAPFIERVTASF